RFKVILRFVVIAIGQIVEAEVDLQMPVHQLRNPRVQNGVAGGNDRRVVTVEPVMIDGAQAKGATPSPPGGHGERGVRNKVRSAVNVDPVIASGEERVRDLRRAGVQGDVACQRTGSLRLGAVSATGSFELETAVVGYINLLLRVIDQETVDRDAEARAI